MIDLHMHSSHSLDGEIPPERLVAMAAAAGMDAVAVADHNRASAVPAAVRAGMKAGIEVVQAIELDCRRGDVPLHILGYFIDADDPAYAALWAEAEKHERAASEEKYRLASRLGISLDRETLFAASPGGIVTAETIAEVAMADPANRTNPLLAPYFPGGARSDNPFVNFYWDHCSPGKPAHVRIERISFREAVALIRGTGGVPVVAHPGMNLKGRPGLLAELAAEGVRGVEAFSSYHSPEECRRWAAEAAALNLAVTCGSDFHGKTKPAIKFGGHGAGAGDELLVALRALVAC